VLHGLAGWMDGVCAVSVRVLTVSVAFCCVARSFVGGLSLCAHCDLFAVMAGLRRDSGRLVCGLCAAVVLLSVLSGTLTQMCVYV